MLTELSIRDFTIIDKVSIHFKEGLTVLTGETGAGKSIIIDAIQLLVGGRGSVEFVRHQCKKAEIEGLFIIENPKHVVFATSRKYGIEISEEQIVLQRTITAKGRSICRVNGKLVTLAILREIGSTLLDIHNQHETQSLMDNANHIDFLDNFDAQRIGKAKTEYLSLYKQLKKLQKRYEELNENEQKIAHRLDLLEFQYNEIEEAHLEMNEDVLLEKERYQLANVERIHYAILEAYNALYGESKGLDWLHIAQQALIDGQEYDSFIDEKAQKLSSFYYDIEELTYSLRNYSDNIAYNPNRLNEIEARLDEINQLKRKYGESVEDILDYMGKIAEEIDEIKYKDSHLSKLEHQIKEMEQDAYLEAKHLHEIRMQVATLLTKEIHKAFKDLYLENATFEISFRKKSGWKGYPDQIRLDENGFDDIKFLISTNPGEPVKELDKIASGGELSRIMLALKGIFAKQQNITSVVFDEVDTGVSGRVAQAMADKIYSISNQSQVLCITHLPQVAAMADSHMYIRKLEKDQRTITNVHELESKEKIDELSRMLTGSELTDTTVKHAKELLDIANERKKTVILP